MFSGSSSVVYALRQLRKNPGFTALAVTIVALGIGANAAIFSVLNGVALTPLGFREPDRLVEVWPALAFNKNLLGQLQEGTRSFSAVSGYSDQRFSLTGVGEAEELSGGVVSVGHFRLLGTEPILGRGFVEEEQVPGAGQVVVLSHGLWQRRFGGDPKILGRTIQLSGLGDPGRTVVGVMPRDYRPLNEAWDLWVPMTIDPANFSDYAGTSRWSVVGRLAPGVTLAQASADVAAFANSMRQEHTWISQDQYAAAGSVSLTEQMLGDVRGPLLILLGAVGFVLLIACANVASLLLAKASGREREIAVRLALGAGRWQVVRQLLVESGMLGLVGGAAGILLAFLSIPALVAALPASVPRTDLIAVDRPVLLVSLFLSLGASVLFGLAPALWATGRYVYEALGQGATRKSPSPGMRRLRSSLVVAEIALSVVLVVGAGLMLRSLWALRQVDPGFDAEGVVTLRLSPPEVRYPDDESVRAYYAQVQERLLAVPGVSGVGMTNSLPLNGPFTWQRISAPGSSIPPEDQPRYTAVQDVSDEYFRTMAIPVLAGRGFTREDGLPPFGVIVNRSAAEAFWPGEDPLGKQLEAQLGVDEPFTVVGVVGDVHWYALNYPAMPEAYFPHSRWTASRMYLAVRVADDPEGRMPLLRSAVWSVDRDVPISGMRTMKQVIGRTMTDSRFLAALLVTFGLIALCLGAVGVYGVVSFTVSRTTSEIGLRMALGAARENILGRILRHSLLLAGMGVGLGLVGAVAGTRVLSRFLFGVQAIDPLTFAGVAVVLVAVALLASYVPAYRASRVDPLVAIRLD